MRGNLTAAKGGRGSRRAIGVRRTGDGAPAAPCARSYSGALIDESLRTEAKLARCEASSRADGPRAAKPTSPMKKLISCFVILFALVASATIATAKDSAPKTVMHVVTVAWKAGTTPEQIQAALEGAQALPTAYPGILRVWTKTVKAQGDRTHVIAMEFKDEEALKNYTKSPAQETWYKVYLPIRDHSTTFDVTN